MQSLKKIHAWAQMQVPLCNVANIYFNAICENKKNVAKISELTVNLQ